MSFWKSFVSFRFVSFRFVSLFIITAVHYRKKEAEIRLQSAPVYTIRCTVSKMLRIGNGVGDTVQREDMEKLRRLSDMVGFYY